eukprot:SAG22_NODE_160_length_16938_cov_3.491241_1_plen_180_part_00
MPGSCFPCAGNIAETFRKAAEADGCQTIRPKDPRHLIDYYRASRMQVATGIGSNVPPMDAAITGGVVQRAEAASDAMARTSHADQLNALHQQVTMLSAGLAGSGAAGGATAGGAAGGATARVERPRSSRAGKSLLCQRPGCGKLQKGHSKWVVDPATLERKKVCPDDPTWRSEWKPLGS